MSFDNAATEDRDNPGLRPSPQSGVGTKFYPDGRVRPFPGNTIICHIPDGRSRNDLLQLHTSLAGLGLGSSIALLPPSSLHMTVFEGVCDQVRGSGYWPSDLAEGATLDVCDALFEHRLRAFALDCVPPYRMRVERLESLAAGISLRLQPIDEFEDRRLRELRDRLSALLQLRHPDHERYVFHVSFAYIIRPLTPEQIDMVSGVVSAWQADPRLLELGAPEFCKFESMFHFERQFDLGAGSGKVTA